MRPRKGEHALGPYRNRDGWIVIRCEADGSRRSRRFSDEAPAREYAEHFNATAEKAARTIDEAIHEYEQHMIAKDNKPKSRTETLRRLRLFLAREFGRGLQMFPPHLGARLFKAFCERPLRPIPFAYVTASVDYRRGMLAEVRTFFAWCVEKKWMADNPMDGVKATGKRRHRKAQLRIDEARRWLAVAEKLADDGEAGATAALCAMALGMRVSEIVSRTVRDLDNDGAWLWIPDSKTEAGRRTLETDFLKPFLLALAEAKQPHDLLFGYHDRKWPLTWVQRICALAGVVKVTAHGMRGLCGTAGVAMGNPAAAVRAYLGHEDERTTMTSYVAPGTAETAARRRGLGVIDGGKR